MKNDNAVNLLQKLIKKLRIYPLSSATALIRSLKQPFVILFCGALFAFTLLDTPADKIPSLLQQFNQKYPQEKVHLHVDRNYFVAGDTLHFKAYVVNAENNQLADLSKVLYVDLVNTENLGIVALRYSLTEGTASGTVAFPDSLKAGTYILRAYTNWMRNFEQDLFYNIPLKIGIAKIQQPKATVPSNRQNLHEISFFPEGGDLVNGITSTVAFKAVDGTGKGEDVSGTITDESGTTLVDFHSAFAGMGRFALKPAAGKHYTAVVKFKNSAVNKIALPAALPSGYVVTVDNQDKTNLNVQINYAGEQASETVWLAAQANNKLISLTEIPISNGSGNLSLPKKKFPTGIIQLTLFDKNSQPRVERLIFSDRRDQLRLDLGAEKALIQNSTVKIPLEATDNLANPISSIFSVAVVNRSRATDSISAIPSILSHLLLTSDLKGDIENPDYYFKDKSAATALKLDNLMLTQGWRRFAWQNLLAGKFPQIAYPIEKKQTLNGRAKNSKGLPLPHIDLLLTSKGDSAFTLRATTNNEGKFTFELPDMEGRQQFSIIASASKTRNDINIVLDQFAPASLGGLSSINPQIAGADQLLNGYLATKPSAPLLTNQARQLKEVVVKSKKITATEKAVAPSGNFNGAGNASQVVTYKDLSHCSTLEACLIGKLVGVYFKTVKDPNSHGYTKIPYSTNGFDKPMLFVLDGVAMQPGQLTLSSIPVGDVQSIEVLRSGALMAAYGIAGSGGVLVITTKKGGIDYNATDEPESKPLTSVPGVFNIIYNGYQKQREFYVPKYPSTGKNMISPETIFWNPTVQTNDEGKTSIEFPLGSNIKKFAVVIEGISADGKIGYKYQEFINN